MLAVPFSLWIAPDAAGRARLSPTIDALAAEFGTTPFLPHITLASVVAAPDAVSAAIADGGGSWPPLRLRCGATAHSPEWKMTLYVEVDDERIHTLGADLCERLGLPFLPVRPHISLLYRADLPLETRASLAARHVFAGIELTFDTIVAMRAPDDVTDVASWDTRVRSGLFAKQPPALVHTIGYEGRTLDELIDELQQHEVDTLVDVRLTPLSRKPGFGRRALAAALIDHGIGYVHMPALGNPKDNRAAFGAGDPAAHHVYDDVLRSATNEVDELLARIRSERIALLCFERDHHVCHRSAIAAALRSRAPSVAVHPL